MARKSNIIEGAMRKNTLVFFFLVVIVVAGFLSLPHLNKNEFPTVTIRTGVVAVVYPGATAEEIEEQVTHKVENYLFTFSDVDMQTTYSYSQDGIMYIFANLVQDVADAQLTWSRIRQGLVLFRMTSLPQGVIATAVIDDFGNSSSLLLAIESQERSSRELSQYIDELSDRLRTIDMMGNIKVSGEKKEEIAVIMDPERLTQYAISPSAVSAELAAHSIRTISGEINNNDGRAIIHVSIPYDDMYSLGELIVYSDPITKQSIRLRDVAKLEQRYAESDSYVLYSDSTVTNNSCMILSMEMRPDHNVVEFGNLVEKQITEFQKTLPPDIHIHRITDQPRLVDQSVLSFLKDLIEAVLVVIIVMLMLFPMKTALVSSTSVPVCIAATFGIMFLLGIELNTVTLAALIVVLGMIVDDSVVVIDGYTDMLHEGHSRWYSASVSTKKLMGSMLIATCSISGMFFPSLFTMTGPMSDFIKLFPWAIFIALSCSFFYAIWVIPYLSSRFIKRTKDDNKTHIEKIQTKFFEMLQNSYQKMLDLCFRHKVSTIMLTLGLVLVGVYLCTLLNIQILPKAERDSFAVEINLSAGSSLDETAAVADSITRILQKDPRVESITSFIGMSSPRFHVTYAPQMASNSYSQFIVNTVSNDATKEIMNEYPTKYENIFPNAQIRFKQMDYQVAAAPIEFYLKSKDLNRIEPIADSLIRAMKENPHLCNVKSNYNQFEEIVEVVLDTDEANRLGITQSALSVYMKGALSGAQMSTKWEGNYDVPITIYTEGVHDLNYDELGDMLIPTATPSMWVPLRQIAQLVPRVHHSMIPHRNGVRCVTISADVLPGYGQLREYKKIAGYLETLELPDGVTWEPGGTAYSTKINLPGLTMSVIAAIIVMFLVLIIHYGKIGISILAISESLICIFGATFGLWLFGLDMGITALLGIISLIGIIVRNAIIMYDYANELVEKEHMDVEHAAYLAGMRRMRPIFLTSATTALGVIPMIIAKTMLWMPMGVVICIGTLITLPLVITVLPVAYTLAFSKSKANKKIKKKLQNA